MANNQPSFWSWILSFFSSAATPPASNAPPSPAPRHDPTPPARPVPPAPAPAPVPATAGKPGKKTLAGLVGVSAAASLFVLIPREESGRVVNAVVENGQVTVTHVRGAEHRTAYRDVVGVLTICDGDTHNVVPGQVATRAECTDRLERQLIAHTEPVLRCVPALGRPERSNQLVAAVSLAYNIGPGRVGGGGFCGSTAARLFNAGRWREGCDALVRHNRAGGRVLAGLTARRNRERAICLRGL